jgi:acyl-CoA synthetase (AMP-forming)/AMP-acid ligase II
MQLQTRGITSKDVVAFCSSNTLDNAIPIIGATYLGARVANLEPSLSVRHVRHLLSIVTPKIIFVEESVVNLIDLVVMVFSTGTAGLPKAICHSHYTLLMAASQMQ